MLWRDKGFSSKPTCYFFRTGNSLWQKVIFFIHLTESNNRRPCSLCIRCLHWMLHSQPTTDSLVIFIKTRYRRSEILRTVWRLLLCFCILLLLLYLHEVRKEDGRRKLLIWYKNSVHAPMVITAIPSWNKWKKPLLEYKYGYINILYLYKIIPLNLKT